MGAGTWESYHAITSLLYRYARLMDDADYPALAALFADAKLTNEGFDGEIVGGDAIADLYRNTNRVHADGTLRTRHITANVVVDIDEEAGSATSQSTFVVLQQTDRIPLQPIVSGRYSDEFARRDDNWHFVHRHISVDLVGDVSEHLTFDLASMREALQE